MMQDNPIVAPPVDTTHGPMAQHVRPSSPVTRIVLLLLLVGIAGGIWWIFHARAKAASADIVRPVHVARTPAFPEGSTQFDLRDPEGNLWTVGTFQPKLD